MQVIVLVVVASETQAITIHETRKDALVALRRFLTEQWFERFGLAFLKDELGTEEAAGQYFADGFGTFIIGEVDLIDIESHFDTEQLSRSGRAT